ncbi:hypothetical protein E0I26_13025 [Flavobacterium rhamnosiphilum]|uniref:Uncharacterized protein n=1 Tax=Flavobacterium rhamnosiphilum TaxID=2541724 RepID=A0A4R5F5A4_9FLAO|nr:hypothetical protein [Flavobacterium rhamnosiphilum]TDE42781.1 hypothetical protein E0I26_13025 [Flavobacterium rhamnosiphilum]
MKKIILLLAFLSFSVIVFSQGKNVKEKKEVNVSPPLLKDGHYVVKILKKSFLKPSNDNPYDKVSVKIVNGIISEVGQGKPYRDNSYSKFIGSRIILDRNGNLIAAVDYLEQDNLKKKGEDNTFVFKLMIVLND